MEITFLGTGAGLPSKGRNVSAIALQLLQEENQIWLFDCGEATQHQILHTSIKPRKINKIFITHLHGDHIFGLPGLLSSRSFQGGDDAVTLYGPTGLRDYVETALRISKSHLNYPITIVEIKDGSVIKENNFTIYVKELDHGVPSFGYRIVEKDSPGELLASKLQAKGIPPGPLYGKIKNNEYINTEQFGTLYRKDFIGPDKPGKIVTVMGDTRYSASFTTFVEQSDVLIYEATFKAEQEDLAFQYFHSTTKQAATLAKEGNVKQLIMTHISSRYQQEDDEDLLQEARVIFPDTELANDFYHHNIR
ncbi:ribonuclease Z [Oceanobacillus alkalisoli]|uniref:ribonuclease Z n=1 Tax=Oceanobacillus alkalisoli TaxID=2925113 RepID=UPI001EE4504B|nr:ribonuclease Z [Oceanobacillus alkalisoli]MCG5102985.1 ribonuclease Z [Oceanobacillus alkalisoli]